MQLCLWPQSKGTPLTCRGVTVAGNANEQVTYISREYWQWMEYTVLLVTISHTCVWQGIHVPSSSRKLFTLRRGAKEVRYYIRVCYEQDHQSDVRHISASDKTCDVIYITLISQKRKWNGGLPATGDDEDDDNADDSTRWVQIRCSHCPGQAQAWTIIIIIMSTMRKQLLTPCSSLFILFLSNLTFTDIKCITMHSNWFFSTANSSSHTLSVTICIGKTTKCGHLSLLSRWNLIPVKT